MTLHRNESYHNMHPSQQYYHQTFHHTSLRTPKTDKADSKKIARYTLDRWAKLKQYGSMDKTRNQLKTMNRQFGFFMAQKTAMKNNLI